MNAIPGFYYDILARIIPGACVLAVLSFWGISLPSRWIGLFTGSGAWNAIVVSVVLAGVTYSIGVLFEALYEAWPLKKLKSWLTLLALETATKDYKKKAVHTDRVPMFCNNDNKQKKVDEEMWSRAAWQWLVYKASDGVLSPFTHAHRFQAEMKLCLHAVLPAAVLLVFLAALLFLRAGKWSVLLYTNEATYFFLDLGLVVLLAWGAYAREKRRWLEVLASVDHLEWNDWNWGTGNLGKLRKEHS